MRVHLGSDHAGFELKAKVAEELRRLGHDPVDHGPTSYDPEDDYPPYCFAAAAAAVADLSTLAIVIGGSGNGEAIAANKVRGARCALAHSDETARLGRQHNDANVLALGSRTTSEQDALQFVEIFVTTPFSGDARHSRRIAQIAAFEDQRATPRQRV